MSQTNIQFYLMPESPPCRIVQMVASHIGINLVEHHLNLLSGDHLKEEHAKINPLRKVPFIIDGDLRINESRAISAYLANKYLPEDNTFYPRKAEDRARVDELLFRDMSLFAFAGQLYRPKMFDHKPLCPNAIKTFTKEMQSLDERLGRNGGKKFLLGDHLTLADLCFAATLSFPEAHEFDLQQFQHISDYQSRLKVAIKDYAKINDKPVENMKNYIKSIKVE